MGKHSNEREAAERPPDPGPPRRDVLLLALGITASLVAWGVLVLAAIDFGREARSGEAAAWIFLALSTLGAAACLFITLILGARLVTLLKGPDPTRPAPQPRQPRQPGRRRAER